MASGASSLYKGSDELVLECDVCKIQGLTSQAVSYCKICTEALCQVCDKVHRASKQTRDHQFLTGDQLDTVTSDFQLIPTVIMCDKHQLPIEYFCKNDNIVFCNICKIAFHRQCDTTEIGKHVVKNEFSQEFVRVHDQLTELEEKYKELKQERTSGKGILKTQIQSCFKDIAKVRKDLNDVLDDLETNMKAEIKAIEEAKTKEINDHLVIINDTLRQILESVNIMKKCKSTTQNHIMFVVMKKAEVLQAEYEHVTANLEREIEEIDVRLKINEHITTQLQQLHPFGNLLRPPSFLGLAVRDRRLYNVDCLCVQEVVILSNGHFVLACGEKGLKLLDENFRLTSELSMRAFKACRVSDTEVLVTLGKHAKVQYVEILPRMVKKKTLTIGRCCSGVDFHNNEIYVACDNNPGNGEVRVLDRNGQLQRRLGFDGEQYMFTDPVDVKVSRNGDKVIVSDWKEDCVVCLDQHGQVLYRYTDRNLQTPYGLHLDAFDNLLVCGFSSHNVHAVSKDGKRRHIILTEKNGIIKPACITYRHSDGCLVVGLNSDDSYSLCSFSTTALAH